MASGSGLIRSTLTITTGAFIDSGRFKTKFKRVVDGTAVQVAEEMTPYAQSLFAPPSPVFYPISWALTGSPPPGKRANMPGGLYSKQKAAFFATNGFGRGIPTRRTNKVGRAWKVIYTPKEEGGTFALQNRVPYARYVYGGFQSGNIYQQQFHKNTGWANAIQTRALIFAELYRRMQQAFSESLGSFGLIEARNL